MRQKTSKEAKGRVQQYRGQALRTGGRPGSWAQEQAMTKGVLLGKYAEGRPPGHGGKRKNQD